MSNAKGRRRRRREEASAQADGAAASRRLGGSRDLRAYLRRVPRPAPVPLALSLLSAVLGNAYLLWLVSQDALGPSAIVLLVLAEGILLSLLAAAQRDAVPPAHRMAMAEPTPKAGDRVLVWTAGIFAIGGAYVMWAFLLGDVDAAIALLTGTDHWVDDGLDIALALTLGFAIAGWMADGHHYRRMGPTLVSSVDMEAMQRRITIVYGAMVIAIPMIALLAVLFQVVPRLVGGRDGIWPLLGMLALVGTLFGGFALMAPMIDSGPLGWSAVYLLGKLIVDGFFVALPLLARRAAAASD